MGNSLAALLLIALRVWSVNRGLALLVLYSNLQCSEQYVSSIFCYFFTSYDSGLSVQCLDDSD